MKIRKREIFPNILALTFEDNYELAMSFIRIQEFYESPKFKNEYFTLEDFIDYWVKDFGNGVFDYPKRWSGFNVPGSVVLQWMEKFDYDNSDDIRQKEKELIKKILSQYKREDLNDVYIIGVAKGKNKKRIVDHEVAHALYLLNPEYKDECDKIISELKSNSFGRAFYDRIADKLVKQGYHEDVVEDEMQAYWSTPAATDKYLYSQFKELRDLVENYKSYRKNPHKNIDSK